MSEQACWYVVHTYSGYEKAVAAAIMKAAENRRMQNLIIETNIPEETITEHTEYGDRIDHRKIFPGYVLVKMILTDESWHLVRNVRGATGFVGSDGKAIALTDQEIHDMGIEHPAEAPTYALGDTVKVTDGPFEGLLCTVEELDVERDRVRVVVPMFGRETLVDLSLDQVELVQSS